MRRPPAGRVLFGLALVVAWMSLGRVLDVRGVPYPHGLSALVDLAPLTTPVAAVIATVLFLAAVVAWVGEALPRAAAAVALVLLALGAHVQGAQWTGDNGANGATVLPGAALAAWLVGQLVPGTPQERADRGHAAACGIVAAVYPLAALAKVLASGLPWASPGNIALHIASHSYGGLEPLRPLRLLAAGSPALCGALGVGTLLIEGGAVAFVWPPARRWVALAVSAMHVGIGVLMGLHHYECMLVAVGLALAPPRSRG